MRNPNDTRFRKITGLMKSGQMIGSNRPVGRVTWTKTPVRTILAEKPGIGRLRYINKHNENAWELGTVQTIDIDRSIGQDAATCTIRLNNSHMGSEAPQGSDTEGLAGYLTAGRGQRGRSGRTSIYRDGTTGKFPTSWGYKENFYRDALIPNTVLRTYQGYGSDNFDQFGEPWGLHDPDYVAPKDDTQLYLTGVWLIDKVTYGGDASITVECRDLAKLLIEQFIYPPMVPLSRFPLRYSPAVRGHKERIGRNVCTFMASSADKRYGANTPVRGHRGTHAFDRKLPTYWLSPGNNSADDVEWLQGHCSGPINEVQLHTVGGNYIAYISVYENGQWQGAHTNVVPGQGEYDSDEGFRYVVATGDTLWDIAQREYGNPLLWPRIAAANDNIVKDPHWIYPGQRLKVPYISGTHNPPPANSGHDGFTPMPMTYVKRITLPNYTGPRGIIIKLPRLYKASRIRITFTNLAKHVHHGDNADVFDYRVGVFRLQARNHVTYLKNTVNKAGFIADWSEAIKELCAWGGFTWPDATPNKPDPQLGWSEPIFSHTGLGRPSTPMRVWGDFEDLGAGPIVETEGDYFMNKSFMEGIRQIVDFIGGIFYVDETGGAQFRLANIWSGGNFIDDPDAPASIGARIKDHPIEFHEEANLVSYSVVIDDAALRSEILVVGAMPSKHSSAPVAGGYVTGYNPVTHTTSAIDFTNILAGQYRLMAVPGDSTKLFKTERECQRMAELTALFILFTYRQGTVHSPAHPGLQIDDQVQIYERVTSEQNIHYVSAITSHQDLDSGEYTMDVTTHWLGKDPNTDWFVNRAQLTPAVKSLPAIIRRTGKADKGSTDTTGVQP